MREFSIKGIRVKVSEKYSPEDFCITLFGKDYYLKYYTEDWKSLEDKEKEILEELSSFEIYLIEPYISEVNRRLIYLNFQQEGEYLKTLINTEKIEEAVEGILRIGMAVYPLSAEFNFFTKESVIVPNLEKGIVRFSVIYKYYEAIPESVDFAKKLAKLLKMEVSEI